MTEKIQITGFSHDGRGIAHIANKIIFLAGGLPNEEVEFNYTKKHTNYDEGIVTKIITPSSYRIEPPCPHFSICGGCSLQHITTEGQVTYKEQALLEQLEHFSHIKPKNILPPLTAQDYGYRRKARLGVKFVIKKNKVIVGFRENNGRFLADLQSCKVLDPKVGELINALGTMIAKLSCKEIIPQIEVAIGDDAAGLVFRHMKALPQTDIDQLMAFAKLHTLKIYLQPQGPDSVHLLYPQTDSFFLQYTLSKYNLTFAFHPTDFIQVNAALNAAMVDRALQLLEPQPEENILDLFCGLGNFTLPLARFCQRVVGVEGDPNMILRAKENAKSNNINNVEFYSADLTQDIQQFAWSQKKFDSIILDPPRTGASEVINTITSFSAKKILYISCNPATLARDAAAITAHGYQLEKVGIMNMFPQTKHTETIALFVK